MSVEVKTYCDGKIGDIPCGAEIKEEGVDGFTIHIRFAVSSGDTVTHFCKRCFDKHFTKKGGFVSLKQ